MPARGHSAKNFFKKKFKLCRVPARGHSAKIFLKKKLKLFADHRPVGTRQRIFFKKIKKSLPSACRAGTRQSDRQRGRRRDGRFSLPSAPRALGKAFAECPIKDTRQRGLCRSIFYLVFFTECRTRQRLCRVQFGICLMPHSAKTLPSVIWHLPSASDTRQRTWI